MFLANLIFYWLQKKSLAWQSLRDSYSLVHRQIEELNPDLILYFSTQWLSVLGYMFQGDPQPEWVHVDSNWHDLGEMPYSFEVDAEFAKIYSDEVGRFGFNTKVVNYRGFPIDTGTIVAQKLLNPNNKFKAAMVSCNMYSEKEENIKIGQAAARALARHGKKSVAVVVSNLSNRFEIKEIDPSADKISSLKDDEWNRKILDMFADGDIEDVSQSTREFARQANADMGFRGLWWLNGLCGETNDFKGNIFDYQPVWGTGSALIGLYPEQEIQAKSFEECLAAQNSEEASQADLVNDVANREGKDNGLQGKVRFKSAEIISEESPSKETSLAASAFEKISSSNAPEPVGAYPHARKQGSFLFLSGVGPRKRATKEIPGVSFNNKGEVIGYDIVLQTKSVIENIETILNDSGCGLKDIVDVQVFLTDMKKDFKKFNKIYTDYFSEIGATRTTVEVNALPTPINVEFKVIAQL